MLGLPLQFLLAQIKLYKTDLRRFLCFPVLLMLGAGMVFNNARAVLEGLIGLGGEFVRTPKFRMEGTDGVWRRSAYMLSADPTAFGEALMAGYVTFMIIEAWKVGNVGAIPFLLLYMGGFVYVAIGSAMSARPPRWRSTVRLKADA